MSWAASGIAAGGATAAMAAFAGNNYRVVAALAPIEATIYYGLAPK